MLFSVTDLYKRKYVIVQLGFPLLFSELNKYLQCVLTHPGVTVKAEYAGVLPLLFRLKHLISVFVHSGYSR